MRMCREEIPANPATSSWSSVGNLSGEIICFNAVERGLCATFHIYCRLREEAYCSRLSCVASSWSGDCYEQSRTQTPINIGLCFAGMYFTA